ncbi:hypothetical protein HZS_1773 [Henneguya salminicola]|nr:hypothetical protein HZS_1773 [Henneguya salminicola]
MNLHTGILTPLLRYGLDDQNETQESRFDDNTTITDSYTIPDSSNNDQKISFSKSDLDNIILNSNLKYPNYAPHGFHQNHDNMDKFSLD